MSLGPVLGSVASQGGFNPETGTDNILAGYWAEASVWTPPAEGADVTSWTNWSDSAYTMPALATGNAPSYTASRSDLNSRPALVFDRANSEHLEVDFTVWTAQVGGAQAGPHTVITVFAVDNLSATQYVFDGDGINYRRTQHIFAGSGTLRAFGGVSCDITGGVSAATPFLAIAEYDATPSLRLIGGGADQTATNSGSIHQMWGFHFGSLYTGGGSFLAGAIALGLITNTTVASLTWVDECVEWAVDHYGIDAGGFDRGFSSGFGS